MKDFTKWAAMWDAYAESNPGDPTPGTPAAMCFNIGLIMAIGGIIGAFIRLTSESDKLVMTSRAILVPIADRMQSPIQIHERADCGTNRSQSSQYQQILYEVFHDTSTFFFRYFYFQNIRRNLPPVFNSGNKKRDGIRPSPSREKVR